MARPKQVQRKPGMDERWFDERGDWGTAQIKAACDRVARAFSRTDGMTDRIYDAFDPELDLRNEWEQAVFVYQLRGQEWTNLESIGNRIYWGVAEELSKKLRTYAMMYSYADTVGVLGYVLYKNGKSIEEFGVGVTPEFDDSNREERLASGWMLSDDNGRQLHSERLKNIDMNSREILDLPNQTAKDFNICIPCDVWEVHRETGKVILSKAWSKDDFEDAKVVVAAY
jgi:hypothetical protein